MRVRIRGDALGLSGYGHAARAYTRALLTAGIPCEFEIVRHDVNAVTIPELLSDPFWKSHWTDLNRRKFCDVIIWIETPEFIDPDPTCVNIAQTNWETSRIPDWDHRKRPSNNWVKQMNRLDGVLTSSQFSGGAFTESGVECPMITIPMPCDTEHFKPGPKTDMFVGQNKADSAKMTFLSVWQWNKRKNPEGLLIAWTTAFAFQEDVLLVLKAYCSSDTEKEEVQKQIKKIRESCHIDALKNIHLITETIPDKDMPNLYRSADVTVHVPYGEGWGLTPQESMACGVPVVYADNTSLSEFATGYPVLCRPEPVHGMRAPWYSCTQTWYRPDPQALVSALRKAYDDWKNHKDVLVRLGTLARRKVETLHNPAVIGEQLASALRQFTGEAAPGPAATGTDFEPYSPSSLEEAGSL